MAITRDVVWVERYRPRKVADTILPAELKTTFQAMVDSGGFPNLLLTGGPGTGKTTVARAMLDELGWDSMLINGSLNGNIDTLRNEILSYASSVSFQGGRKCVILDEADHLNPQSTQPALRNFMEEFSGNCGFILTCNFPNRIIEPLHSRCSTIEFRIPSGEKAKLAVAFIKRLLVILDENGITYEKEAVAELVKRYMPDWRRCLNEAQRLSKLGRISMDRVVTLKDANFAALVQSMKARNYTDARKWVGQNSDIEGTTIFRRFYDAAYDQFKPDSVPQLDILIAQYQYRQSHAVDREVNMSAFLAEVMSSCEFK